MQSWLQFDEGAEGRPRAPRAPDARPTVPFLRPVERPRSLAMRAIYFFSRRHVGKVITPLTVLPPRLPLAFGSFIGKVSKLDRKLVLPTRTQELVRARVASLNGCAFCWDAARWFALQHSEEDGARLDALADYKTSPLFTDAERAALDYATEITADHEVDPATFARLAQHFAERQICEIVWLVASEHLYNIANIALNIGSDNLCELRLQRKGH